MQSLVEIQKFFLKSLVVPNYDQKLQEFGRSFRSFDYEKASLWGFKSIIESYLEIIYYKTLDFNHLRFLSRLPSKKEALWMAFDIVFYSFQRTCLDLFLPLNVVNILGVDEEMILF